MDKRELFELTTSNDEKSISSGTDTDFKSSWGLGNHLYLYSSHHHNANENAIEKSLTNKSRGHIGVDHVTWDIDMQQEGMRKMLCESRYIFMRAQQELIEPFNNDIPQINLFNKLLGYSHHYRSVIKSCATQLRTSLRFIKSNDERRNAIGQLEIVEMMELLWSLCEIVFINQTDNYTVNHLMEWYSSRFYDGDEKAHTLIESGLYDKHELYWDVIFSFVCHGRIEEARKLLSLHSSSPPPPPSSSSFSSSSSSSSSLGVMLKTMNMLLDKMPVFVPGHQSQNEFLLKWKQWHMACEEHDEGGTFADHRELNLLCQLLAGRDQAFTQLRHLLGTWYGMMISRLFYQSPLAEVVDLQHYTQFCIDQYGGSLKLTPWDNIILSIMQLDVKQSIYIACTTFSNWWFVCHLTDLLQHLGCIEDKKMGFGSNLREFFVLEYASSLVSCPSLIDVAIDYYSYCPVFGRSHISELVLRSSAHTSLKVEKLLHVCFKYQLIEEASILCKSQAMSSLSCKQYANALVWAVKSRDLHFTSVIMQRLLAGNIITMESLDAWDVFTSMGTSIHLNGRLSILTKLVEYKKQVDGGNLKGAVANLVLLMKEAVSYKEYFPLLLNIATSLLSNQNIEPTTDQLFKLNEYVYEYKDALKHKRVKDEFTRTINSNDVISSMHLQLTNHIASSLFK